MRTWIEKTQEWFWFVGPEYAVNLYEEYIEKIKDVDTDIFWYQIRKNGVAHKQRLGIHYFYSRLSRDIARFVGKDEVEIKKFKGHSIQRTAASIAVRNGATMMQLKMWGHWKSASSAQIYVENSVAIKRRLSELVTTEVTKTRKEKWK